MVTAEELQQVMPNLSKKKLEKYLPLMQQAMTEFEINTYLREAAFLAQLAHESMGLEAFEELGTGDQYEGVGWLGNTQPGDGRRFKGRGPIQLTGRHNYGVYGSKLGVDLVSNPEKAAEPEVGFRVACLYWVENGLNELADDQNFVQITQRINGGQNGAAERSDYYARALMVLSQSDAVKPPPNLQIDGVTVDSAAIWRGDKIFVKLKVVAEKAAWRILNTEAGKAVIQGPAKENVTVDLLILDNVGYSPARSLPFRIDWNAKTETLSIKTKVNETVAPTLSKDLDLAAKPGEWKLISPPEAWRNAIPLQEELIPLVQTLAKNYGWVIKVDAEHRKVYAGPDRQKMVAPEIKPVDSATFKYEKEPSDPSDPYYAGGFDKKGQLLKLSPGILNTPVSEHFKVSEFACNNADYRQFVRIHPDLVKLLEKIRTKVGSAIHLTNAHRPWPHNRAVGGEINSQHIAGLAADIYCDDISIGQLHAICDEIVGDTGGVGRYSTFVHVDARGSAARWDG